MLYIGQTPEILGIRRFEMNIEQPNHDPEDIAFAGILVIALFSMCIGVFLGIVVGS
jgi:hypothetical protein